MSKIEGVERFMRRVEQAQRGSAKEVRLTIQEAQEAATGIATALARLAILEDRLREFEAPQEARIDGGGWGTR